MTKKAFFALSALISLLFLSCSLLNQSNDTGSLSFTITSDMVKQIKSKSLAHSRAVIDEEGGGFDNADELFLTVELKGAYIDKKTVAIEDGLKVLFEEIPVGTVVKAEGTAFRKENDKNIILYKGETDEITIAEDENALALVLLPYEDIDDTAAENLIGTKQKPNAVGDIVFSDGSATEYSADLTLTDEQKASAIAVIFYAGTSSDSLGARILGIGIHNSSEESANGGLYDWASTGSVAKNLESDVTQLKNTFNDIMAYEVNEEPSEAHVSYNNNSYFLKGDLNGSDNWALIRQKDAAGEYPAFAWVNNYGTKYSLPEEYETGWYMPTAAELMTLRTNLYDVDNESQVINTILQKVNGTKLDTSSGGNHFHSSNLTDAKDSADHQLVSMNVRFGGGTPIGQGVSILSCYVCAIREF